MKYTKKIMEKMHRATEDPGMPITLTEARNIVRPTHAREDGRLGDVARRLYDTYNDLSAAHAARADARRIREDDRRYGAFRRAIPDALERELSGNFTRNVKFALNLPRNIDWSSLQSAGIDAWRTTEAGAQYSTRCTYRRTDVVYHYIIPRDWERRVNARGLPVLDNLLTLWVQPIRGQEGVYEVIWAEAHRGGIRSQAGVVAVGRVSGEQYAYHVPFLARTGKLTAIKKAAEGLARKINRAKLNRLEAIVRDRLEAGRCDGDSEIMVTLADSESAGNCLAGSRAWRDRHFPGRDSASVQEVIQIRDSRQLAILACVAAIRHAGQLDASSSA